MSDQNEKSKAEHAEDRRQHAEWLRDISRWRVDHRKALSIIAQVESMIFELDSEMEAHAAAIRDHHLKMMQHERGIDDGAIDDSNREKVDLEHAEMEQLHKDVREYHDNLEERHEELMNDLAVLFDALQWDSQEP